MSHRESSLAVTRPTVYAGSIEPEEEVSMTNRTNRWYGLVAGLALLGSGTAFAADEPSPEQRQQMAAVHQKMADCLKSSRPMGECRSEMLTNCQSMMGAAGCPMMESAGGTMGPGMMGSGMGPGMMGPGHGKKTQSGTTKEEPAK